MTKNKKIHSHKKFLKIQEEDTVLSEFADKRGRTFNRTKALKRDEVWMLGIIHRKKVYEMIEKRSSR